MSAILLSRLRCTSQYAMKNRCSKDLIQKSCLAIPRMEYSQAKQATEEESKLEDPVKFSTSEAAKWKAAYSRSGVHEEDEIPDIQPFIVTFSLSVFMIYFFILREENDIDEKLYSNHLFPVAESK